MVGISFGDSGCNDANAGFRDQLHADSSSRIGALQVVNQLKHTCTLLHAEAVVYLSQIFNAVDVVVRRWRDESHARCRLPGSGDLLRDLVSRQLTALSGLGTLRHLDLQLVSIGKVRAIHAESGGCHLRLGISPIKCCRSAPV